jgi:hypothetical protein
MGKNKSGRFSIQTYFLQVNRRYTISSRDKFSKGTINRCDASRALYSI